jgi:GGDEF domain-containing protein
VRELEQELQRVNGLIRCDQLTGALNRRGLEDRFAREAQDARRQNQPLSLVMLDVDDFRLVNTRFAIPAAMPCCVTWWNSPATPCARWTRWHGSAARNS